MLGDGEFGLYFYVDIQNMSLDFQIVKVGMETETGDTCVGR